MDWLQEQGCEPDMKCSEEKHREKLAELADKIMSCKIPDESNDDEQNMLRDFVLDSLDQRCGCPVLP